MAGVSSTGLGSGIDINSLVSGLIQAESAPTTARLDNKEASLQAELSAVGLLKSALSEFQDSLSALTTAETLITRSASSSDSSIAAFSADNDAATGSYSLEVTSLATAQKIVSQQDYVVSEGSLVFSNASESFTVTLTSANNATIQDVRDAINNASDNIGITATIIKVNGNERLVFTADDTGLDSAMSIAGTSTSGDLDIYDYNTGAATPDANGDVVGLFDQAVAGADAQFLIDGQAMTSASNTIEDVIPNATLTLKDANPNAPITLTVSSTNSALNGQIDNFVKSFNTLMTNINDLTAYDSATSSKAALFGDSLVNTLERQLRSAMTTPITNSGSVYTSLASIGITTQSDGTLVADSTKLSTALTNDYTGVATLFSDADKGIAQAVDNLLESYLTTDGAFDGRTDSINRKLDAIGDERGRLDLRLSKLEARLFAQYNAMDSLVYSLNQTGSWLESSLATLPGSVSTKK